MAESNDFMSPEAALVEALETVPALRGRISAIQPPAKGSPPFCFYIPTADAVEEELAGPTELRSWGATVHLVAAGANALYALCALARQAVDNMRGSVYGEAGNRILVERSRMEQISPDLYEAEVGLFRRMYTVSLDLQAEADNQQEVISG